MTEVMQEWEPTALQAAENSLLEQGISALSPLIKQRRFTRRLQRGELQVLLTDDVSIQLTLFGEVGSLDIAVGCVHNHADVAVWALRKSRQAARWKVRGEIVNDQIQLYLIGYVERPLFLNGLVPLIIEGWEEAVKWQGELNVWWNRLESVDNSN